MEAHTNWDDDERSLNITNINRLMRENQPAINKDVDYIPVTRVMKEYYDEEKRNLYSYEPQIGTYRTYETYGTYQVDYDEASFEGDSAYSISDYSVEPQDDDTTDVASSEDPSDSTSTSDHLAKIIDDAVYKKFSYV